jgi:hypothetical protein
MMVVSGPEEKAGLTRDDNFSSNAETMIDPRNWGRGSGINLKDTTIKIGRVDGPITQEDPTWKEYFFLGGGKIDLTTDGEDEEATGIFLDDAGGVDIKAKAGDFTVEAHDDIKFTSEGNFQVEAGDFIDLSATTTGPDNHVKIEAQDGPVDIIAGSGDMTLVARGEGAVSLSSSDIIDIYAESTITIDTHGDIHVDSRGETTLQLQGPVGLIASNLFRMDTNQTTLHSIQDTTISSDAITTMVSKEKTILHSYASSGNSSAIDVSPNDIVCDTSSLEINLHNTPTSTIHFNHFGFSLDAYALSAHVTNGPLALSAENEVILESVTGTPSSKILLKADTIELDSANIITPTPPGFTEPPVVIYRSYFNVDGNFTTIPPVYLTLTNWDEALEPNRWDNLDVYTNWNSLVRSANYYNYFSDHSEGLDPVPYAIELKGWGMWYEIKFYAMFSRTTENKYISTRIRSILVDEDRVILPQPGADRRYTMVGINHGSALHDPLNPIPITTIPITFSSLVLVPNNGKKQYCMFQFRNLGHNQLLYQMYVEIRCVLPGGGTLAEREQPNAE